MNPRRIADTGLLKAFLHAGDAHHAWGLREFPAGAPWHTCEPVLTELSYLLDTPVPGVELMARGDVIVDFSLHERHIRVLELLKKYRDQQMELADACVVAMAEQGGVVWTVDRQDFSVYRLGRGRLVPMRTP